MSKVDWSKAPEWATCVVVRSTDKFSTDYHWSEKPMDGARMMRIETGTIFLMSKVLWWTVIEHRPTRVNDIPEGDIITTVYKPMSPVDLHLSHSFTPVEQPSTAPELLNQAARLLAERGKQYDKSGEERSAAAIVAAFNAITKRDLTPGEGWLFMVLLKAVRFYSNTETPHRDSLEDMIAYVALHAEEYLNDK
ncbi:phosphofructokinase [Klebsiella phage VLCpiS10a]|nr:phosphofructokinase [Klebsiella phage VLCpiS10a]